MKKILISLSVVLSLALFSHIGLSADLAIPVTASSVSVVNAAPELLAQARATQPPPLQLAAIGDSNGRRSAGLQDAGPADKATVEGLPSTPIALATLLLVICILVGRRNN
jgi:hypothetical protein